MKSCAVVTEEQHQTDRHEHQSPVQSQSPELQAWWAASPFGWTTSPRTTVNCCCMADGGHGKKPVTGKKGTPRAVTEK